MNTGQPVIPNPPATMTVNAGLKDKEAEEIILNYFKKKGFKQAEGIFQWID